MEDLTINEIEKKLATDSQKGLTSISAKERLEKDGLNELAKAKNKPWYLILLLSLLEPLSIILITAGVISVVIEKIVAGKSSIIELIVIIVIVFTNAILQTVQQIKAQKSITELEKMVVNKVTVKRDNQIIEVETTNLVVGDIVILEAGKYIPADLRLIETNRLMVDESSLTGESIVVEKNSNILDNKKTVLADKKNIAFMSTFITNGRGVGIVIANAKNSEIGKIAADITKIGQSKTPLQLRLAKFTKWISIIAVLLAILLFLFFYLVSPKQWPDNFLTSVTIAIAIIPESLIVIVSIILAISLKQMAKVNVLVKKLDAVETLGSVNIICTDKTGTLTQNKMEVKEIWYNNEILANSNFRFIQDKMLHFINALTLCNDAINEKKEKIGDPTEIALVDFTRCVTFKETEWRKKYQRIEELPFDSDRKLMATVNHVNNHQYVYVKGSIEALLEKCDHILLNNKVIKLTNELKVKIINDGEKWSHSALRVIGCAYKEKDNNEIEENLIFLGAVGMIDAIRSEAVDAVARAHQAGIRVIMITGDHLITALAIAKQLAIANERKQVLSGSEIDKLSDKQLLKKIMLINVFARVNPSHKTRIVNCLKKLNYVVAMTGDGVNDAPSLSNADIGIAMGITGTDVAKQAANIILQDDNFATIIKGVEAGRNVYYKIKKAISFIMIANLASVITFLVIVLTARVKPFDAINILWYNLVIETILAIPFGLDYNDERLMYQKSRQKNESLFHSNLINILIIGIIISLCAIAIFFIGKNVFDNTIYGKVGTILFLDCTPCFYVWQVKISDLKKLNKTKKLISNQKLSLWQWTKKIVKFSKDKKINKYMLIATVIAFVLNLIIIFVPFVNRIFLVDIGINNLSYEFINWSMIGIVIAMFGILILLIALYNLFIYSIKK